MVGKIEFAGRLKAAGIALPDNWGKLSTSRAEAWMTNEIAAHEILKEHAAAEAPKKRSGLGGALAGAAAAVAAMAGAVGSTASAVLGFSEAAAPGKKTPQTKAATMPKDPKWKRQGCTKDGRLRPKQWRPCRRAADAPDPITRQVARRFTMNMGEPANTFREFLNLPAASENTNA